MHEVTHGVLKNTNHTKAQELACEKRGLTIAQKLYDSLEGNEKKNFDFHIFSNLLFSDLKDDTAKNNYLNNWISYYNLPDD